MKQQTRNENENENGVTIFVNFWLRGKINMNKKK